MARVANMRGDIPEITHQVRGLFVHAITLRLPLILSSILLGLAAAGCSTPTNYSNRKTEADFVRPDFDQHRTNVIRVAIMPPQVDILRQRFWRERKAADKEATATSLKLQQLVAAQLRYVGFTVQSPPTDKTISADDRKRLDEWLSYAAWISIPEDLAPAKALANATHADVLVCIKYSSTKTTWQRHLRDYHSLAAGCVGAVAGVGGVLAGIYFSHAEGVGGEGVAGLAILGGVGGYFLFRETSWLITGGGDQDLTPLPNRAVLHIALVDGATGEVLWSNSTVVESGPKNLEQMVGDVFLSFPR